MVQLGILTKLRTMADEVTTAEARACNFITENAELVLNSPLHAIADASGTSEATIIRLCRKVDLAGFQELRLALARDHASHQIDAIHEDVGLTDQPGVVLNKVFRGFVNTLNDTLKITDEVQFSAVLAAVGQAKSINFFGVGASGSVAQNAYYRFMRLGIPCYVLTDSSSQLSRVALLGQGDVVIAISHSGRSRDVVFAVESARARGVTCIAITQYGQQPLVKASDFVLYTSSIETAFRTEAMASRVAHQALLDAVFVGVSLTKYETVVAAIDENRKLTEQLYQ